MNKSLIRSIRSGICLKLLLVCWIPAFAASADSARPVTLAPVEQLYVYPSKDAPAQVVSLNDAQVSAEAPGVVTQFEVQVGDQLGTGDLIATLDCREHEINAEVARAELKSAEARFGFARTQLESAKKLSSKKGIAQERLEERRSEYAVALAQIDRANAEVKDAERLVDHCQIRAPFSGIVVERIASVGDYATAGTPIARLVDTEKVEVSARVQEADLPSLERARELSFFDRRKRLPLNLRSILPVMESRLRSYEVRLAFSGPRASSGTSGRLQWRSPWAHIPSEYLVRRGADLGIFVFSDGLARFVAIDGARPGRAARVDLEVGTLVVLDGRHGLNSNDRVLVTDGNAH